MTKTRATFTLGTAFLIIGVLTRLITPVVSDTALIVFTLWIVAGAIVALSDDLTGKH